MKKLVVSYFTVYPSRMKKEPLRSEENTTLTISISKTLKRRIEIAAKKDERKISPWCAVRLRELLDYMDAVASESAKAADNGADQAEINNAPRNPTNYRDLKSLPKPKDDEKTG